VPPPPGKAREIVTRRLLPAAGLVLIAAGAWAGADAARRTFWTTTDEPFHVASARELRSGPGLVSNVEHPVLMKVLAAAALPGEKASRPVDETRAARRLFPAVFALLVLVAGAWAVRRAGAAFGLAAAALLAIEPSFRGHGALVTSDVLVALFLVAAAAAADRAGAAGFKARPGWLAAAGTLYGLAMASKYSAAPYLAVFAAFAALSAFRAGAAPFRARLTRMAGAGVLLVLAAILTLAAVQAAAFATTSEADFRRGLAAQFAELPQRRAVERLADGLPRWAASYGAGLLFVQGVAGPGERINYFLGEASGVGFPAYFPVALAVKLTTAAAVALAVSPLAVAAALARAPGRRRRRLLRLFAARSLFPASLGLAWLLAAMLSNVDIGVRHVFPVVPLFLVAAAGAGRTLLRRRRAAALAVVVVLLAGAEAAARHGREISFGNLFAGGNAGLPRIVSDSNVDWSQEQGRVFARTRHGDLGRVGVVALFVDEEAARAAGVAGMVFRPDAPVDAVFFSRHLWDLAPAVERCPESFPKIVWAREWLPALRRGLQERATSVEPFGDAYVLLRLKAPPGG
jgi:hypothetical protein